MSKNTKHGVATIRNWFFILIFLGIIVLLVSSIINASKKIRTTGQSLEMAEQEYQELYERGQSVDEILKNFEDDFGFEKYVRENFGVVKPGEKLIIVSSDKNSHKSSIEEGSQD